MNWTKTYPTGAAILAQIVFLAILLLAAVSASAEVYDLAPNPELRSSWLGLDRYPGMLIGTIDGRSFGLVPAKLTAPLFALRYRAGHAQWVEVALPAGTAVAVDSAGRPWYVLPIGMRIYVPPLP